MERSVRMDGRVALAAIGLAVVSVISLRSVNASAALGNRQATWIGAGLLLAAVFTLVHYRTWGEIAPLLYGANVVGLALVLVHGLRINGSRSWIDLGPFNVQPSEFMKLTTVLLASRVVAGFRGKTATVSLIVTLGAVIGVPLLLVAKQPDFGTALTFVAIGGVYLVSVGLSRRTWAVLLVAGVLGSVAMWTYALKDYQKARIRTFLSPEVDPLAMGYQIIQSRIGIGSGGWTGKGFAEGTQSQLDFLPEKSTDFIFSVIAEAWGFAGSLVVVGLYLLLMSGAIRAAMLSRDAFGAYLAVGIMSVLATHVLVNLGMVTGLLPTIGIPLPLLSYGGSSVVTTLAGLGLLLNVKMRARER